MRNIVWIGITLGLVASTGCGDSPTSPTPHDRSYPHWVSHTYYCRNTAGTVAYTVPPGHGTCDPGDITVRVDPPIR